MGGGIGGLATAACLRARGFDADVYERAAELREVGAALGLWPNATLVLQHLGVLDALKKLAHVPAAGALRDVRGKVIMKMQALETAVPTIFAHRADLHRVLLSVIPSDGLHLNKNCTSIEREGSRVRAIFADSTCSPWADGLLGADGIRSVVRDMTLHDGPPTYRGYVAWRGVAAFDPGEEMVGETWGRGQRFGFIPLGQGVHGAGDSGAVAPDAAAGPRVGWWATANMPESQADDTCRQPQAAWKKEVLARFKNWHRPIRDLLEATPESAFLCSAILDRPPPSADKPWGDGPVTLLGDAAHPTTPNLGQGACMAIEDAAVVAHAVASIPEIPTALRVYEMSRVARTAMIVSESLKFGKIGQWENPLACALRDALVRVAPEKRMRKQFRELWTYDAWEAPLIMRG